MSEEVVARLARIREEAQTWCEASVQDEGDITEIMADDIPWMLDLISALTAQIKISPVPKPSGVRAGPWIRSSGQARYVASAKNDIQHLLAFASESNWGAWDRPGFASREARGTEAGLEANRAAADAQHLAWGTALEDVSSGGSDV